MLTKKTFFVVNPAASCGRAGEVWPRIKNYLGYVLNDFDFEMTGEPGDAIAFTSQAIEDGYDTVVAVGGDGTVNEVVNGFFEEGRLLKEDVSLGILSFGTGGDFVKSLGWGRSWEDQVAKLTGGKRRKIDVGRLLFAVEEGIKKERYFINIADCGIVGDVLKRVKKNPGWLGGFSYTKAGIESFISFKNPVVDITVDGERMGKMKSAAVIVANGQYFGGGMRVAPKAEIDDGEFDLLIVGDIKIYDFLLSIPKLLKGRFFDHPKIKYMRAKEVRVVSDEEVLLDVDGEQPGRVPVEFKILPQALTIIS